MLGKGEIPKRLYSLRVTLAYVCHNVYSYVQAGWRDLEKVPTYLEKQVDGHIFINS